MGQAFTLRLPFAPITLSAFKLSYMSATFNFPPVGIPQHHDQLHATIQSDNGTPSPNFSAFSSAMAPSQHFRDAPSSPPPAMVIDALLIDNLAKDFQLEPVQRANLHAFVQVIRHP